MNKEFIKDYLDRGFGSMNKNDFEVCIFHWLLNYDDNCKGKSDFVISQYLKIPVSKIKRLRYEASLKYEDKCDYRQELLDAIKNAKLQEGVSEWKISLSIKDKILREYLSDILEKDGRFFDGSFNSNIVTLSSGSFVYVLEQVVLNDEEKKKIIDEAKKQVKDEKKMPKTFVETMKELGVDFGKSILKSVVGASADNIVDCIINAINVKEEVVIKANRKYSKE